MVFSGPASGLTAKLCSQAPVLSQRVETQARLARNWAPVVPGMAMCPLPHCVPGLACRLELAPLLPRQGPWGLLAYHMAQEKVSGKTMPAPAGHPS